MNLLITGGSGKLGARILSALGAVSGIHARALVHRTPLKQAACAALPGDLALPGSLDEATRGVDAVLHLAALTHARREADYFRINTEGTRNLVRACEQNGVRRFIHMSSRAALPDAGAYSKSKWEAEAIVTQSSLPWTLLKPAEVYGTGTGEGLGQLMQWIQRYPIVPIIGDGEYEMSPVHVEDVVSATVSALTRPGLERMSLVLAGPEVMTFNTLVDRICALMKKRRMKIHLPAGWVLCAARIWSQFQMGGIAPDQIPRLLCGKPSDTSLARKHLDFNPRTLEEGIRHDGFPA